jgi:hypothetical protein
MLREQRFDMAGLSISAKSRKDTLRQSELPNAFNALEGRRQRGVKFDTFIVRLVVEKQPLGSLSFRLRDSRERIRFGALLHEPHEWF